MSKKTHTAVSIESFKLGLLNRAILDNVTIRDQQDSVMLDLNRLAVKMEISQLFKGNIVINNAQLFGANAHIYQLEKERPANIQFLIDLFSPQKKDQDSKLNLGIESLLVRKCSLRYDKYFMPEGDRFDPNHLHISDLSITAKLNIRNGRSFDLKLKKLSFKEASGFILNSISGDFHLSPRRLSTSGLEIHLPHSSLHIPQLVFVSKNGNFLKPSRALLMEMSGNAECYSSVSLLDLNFFSKTLRPVDHTIHTSLSCSVADGRLSVPSFYSAEGKGLFDINASGTYSFSSDKLQVSLKKGFVQTEILKVLTEGCGIEIPQALHKLQNMGDVTLTGDLSYAPSRFDCHLASNSQVGSLRIDLLSPDHRALSGDLKVRDLELGQILGMKPQAMVKKMTGDFSFEGLIPQKQTPLQFSVKGDLDHITFKDYEYQHIPVEFSIDNDLYTLNTSIQDPNGNIALNARSRISSDHKELNLQGELAQVNLKRLRLTDALRDETISSKIFLDIQMNKDRMVFGSANLSDVIFFSDSLGYAKLGNIDVKNVPTSEGQHLTLDSEILNLEASGKFNLLEIHKNLLSTLNRALPSFFKSENYASNKAQNFEFSLHAQDTTFIKRIAGINLSIPQEANIQAQMKDSINSTKIIAQIPALQWGNEKLENTDFNFETSEQDIKADFKTQRIIKDKPVDVHLETYTNQQKLFSRLDWDNRQQPRQAGTLNLTGSFHESTDGGQAVTAMLNESQFIINDTTWTVHPAHINYQDQLIEVENIRVSEGDRFLAVNGRINKEGSDTLVVDVHDINLAYVFDIINFHAVDFDGNATGRVYARQLMSSPVIDAYLQVNNFTFNKGYMGDMDIHLNWDKAPFSVTGVDKYNQLSIDANITDSEVRHQTFVNGVVIPGSSPQSGFDLDIRAQRINLHFLNRYTEGIFSNVEGRATGWCRVYGPFKKINIEGDLVAEECQMYVDMIGVEYRFEGDSVHLRPGDIHIPHARIYDHQGAPGSTAHSAVVDGHLYHDYLKKLRYNFNIQADHILCYKFDDFDDLNFYGTVYADGSVNINGKPGTLNIDVDATPLAGTTFVFNASQPESITEAGFLTYKSFRKEEQTDSTSTSPDPPVLEDIPNDVFMNFNIHITPEPSMKILMDARSGDHLMVYGSGDIQANYYNKGDFKMYGTYTVDHGTYKLSLQDFIRKDFQLQQGGTVSFNGNAYQAQLNVKALYTVPNVSLDDLSETGLGFSNTRVDCVMNIGGRALSPMVSFDFDLPNASEDEKQMVRSLINTEEERNMQAIYLLGIGRFYSYGAQNQSNNVGQGSMAMNSLISSTLSNQFNHVLSNALGTNNWTVGANLRTSDVGWEQVDIEGMLSGRMLNNRLIINGNFGYRESYYSTNNFVGDFDLEYYLTPGGGLSLKAYNQTNDRYFIQSSLTTQGVGIKYTRDFNHWREAFQRRNKKKSRSKKKAAKE